MCGPIACDDTTPNDLQSVEHLLDLAFGSDRRSKTSYRLREGNSAVPGLSLVTRDTGVGLSGTISFWPLAVHPDRQGLGLGIALMQEGLARAKAQGHGLVLLVGDEPYYAKVGFAKLPEGLISLPGPVDPRRFLYVELTPGALAGVTGLAQVPGSMALAVPHASKGEQNHCEA